MQDKTSIDFIKELPCVFDIIKHNTDAIVDDTAIERLLNWLEEICNQKNQQLFEISIEFLQSKEIWDSATALSFALRFAGFLGCVCISVNDKLTRTIQDLLRDVAEHEIFNQPSVQYCFFKSLTSLTKEPQWSEYLADFLKITLESFQNSFLYVKKSSITYLASYLHLLINEKSLLLSSLSESMCSASDNVLIHVLDSIVKLYEKSSACALEFLYSNNFLQMVVTHIKTSQSNDLLTSLIELFSLLTSSPINADWQQIIPLKDGSIETYISEFVTFVQKHALLSKQLPGLCESLIIPTKYSSSFCDGWNSRLLNIMLQDIIQESSNLKKDLWKKNFLNTIVSMCRVQKKICLDDQCQLQLNKFTCFCTKALLISINEYHHEIDEILVPIVNDKKISRLCFQYFNSLSFNDLSKETKDEFLLVLWTSLSGSSDSTQLICSSLDLFSKLVKEDEKVFTLLQVTVSERDTGKTLADVLAMKMWDISWEVKDSLIGLIIEMVNCSTRGSKSCEKFLLEYLFWCDVNHLINDDESYVRAKAITCLGILFLNNALWDVYCKKNSVVKDVIWSDLKDEFLKVKRQDDMFTRRSILRVVTSLIESDKLFQFADEKDEQPIYKRISKTCLLPVLNNGSNDFDWEVRKLTVLVWSTVCSVFTKHNFQTFLDMLVSNGFAYGLLTALFDCEYEVKKVTIQCLQSIKNGIDKHSMNTHYETDEPIRKKNKLPQPIKIEYINSIDDIEKFVKTFDCNSSKMSEMDFVELLRRIEFSDLLINLEEIDVTVRSDPISFLNDIISSSKQTDANLLDCY